MHGAVPYIMEIAIMYASPIVIVALKDGRKRKKGTVAIANKANISQVLLSGGLVAIFHPAQTIIGKARHATEATYTLSLNGNSLQFITDYPAYTMLCIGSMPLGA